MTASAVVSRNVWLQTEAGVLESHGLFLLGDLSLKSLSHLLIHLIITRALAPRSQQPQKELQHPPVVEGHVEVVGDGDQYPVVASGVLGHRG